MVQTVCQLQALAMQRQGISPGIEVFGFASGLHLLVRSTSGPRQSTARSRWTCARSPLGGVEMHQALIDCGLHAPNPILLLSGNGTIHVAIASMQRGAVDFLEIAVHG